ncbi:hypothetical protein HAL013_02350 [Helicobacter ailurogastricus]|uniref:Uncharacterized protein n=1 Tax=Helicobacter ailurogastricus TaxID=1578720 RepID=A0A0K2X6A8_9HELI|nr:hypothetical protein HAL011_09020 [Helicobacter ailurogastricus]CRF42079.1 hypothetical protein HAL013_02350 [Helicobacter ailurogastricus]CRF44958.1 hypothetical protein HAL09_15860 [Helicobacter ailurogastricus]
MTSKKLLMGIAHFEAMDKKYVEIKSIQILDSHKIVDLACKRANSPQH